MTGREKVLDILVRQGPISGAEISRMIGISRQGVHKILKSLQNENLILKTGKTKGALFSSSDGTTVETPHTIRRKYRVAGLSEERVFDELALLLNVSNHMNTEGFKIFQYAFTEMMNNVIDHSFSELCEVQIAINKYSSEFLIRDFGRGLFDSLKEQLKLADEYETLGELLKGKRTTMPERHSGEGIFFTSKAGDSIAFRSHRIKLVFDNLKKDVFTSEKRFLKGTEVWFQSKNNTKRKLHELFLEYAPEEYDYQFEKSRIFVKLYQKFYVSRSEAKRLTTGLRDFQEIILDFKGVHEIGQGFADEVFRVYKKDHPGVVLKVENANRVIQAMITHIGG
jgi:biotin operon repressor